MEITSNWAKALEPNILAWVHDGLATHPDSTTEIFNVSSNSTGVWRFQNSWGPKRISLSSEGATSHESSLTKGYHTLVAPKIFKEKISTSWAMVRRKQYDEIGNYAKDLGSAMIETINAEASKVEINAQNTAYTAFGDSLPLASTVHTSPDGGSTKSNASSTGITLTEPNLETGMTAIKQQQSGAGKKLAIGNGNLVLQAPEALDKEAIIITGSQKRSGVNTNDLNWYLGKIAVYINPHIGSDITDVDGNSGSDTAWSLLSKGNHSLKFTYEVRPVYKNWEDEDVDAMYTKIYGSMLAYWTDYRGYWRTAGDELAYAD